jgi:hypothetical protein
VERRRRVDFALFAEGRLAWKGKSFELPSFEAVDVDFTRCVLDMMSPQRVKRVLQKMCAVCEHLVLAREPEQRVCRPSLRGTA